jgi:hypothetical protein
VAHTVRAAVGRSTASTQPSGFAVEYMAVTFAGTSFDKRRGWDSNPPTKRFERVLRPRSRPRWAIGRRAVHHYRRTAVCRERVARLLLTTRSILDTGGSGKGLQLDRRVELAESLDRAPLELPHCLRRDLQQLGRQFLGTFVATNAETQLDDPPRRRLKQ